MTGAGAIMMRQEKDNDPSEVQEPQRLVVSLNRTAFARLPMAPVCRATSASISVLASRLRKSAMRRGRCRRSPVTISSGPRSSLLTVTVPRVVGS